MRVEISVENNNEEFEHEGYYDSVQDAINALYDLKREEISEIFNTTHDIEEAEEVVKDEVSIS